MKRLSLFLDERQVRELIASVDVDGDMCVNRDEFVPLMARRLLIEQSETLESSFNVFDQVPLRPRAHCRASSLLQVHVRKQSVFRHLR